MNRLSPTIVRSLGSRATLPSMPLPEVEASSSKLLDDLRLFATGWLGGLIFFGTLLA